MRRVKVIVLAGGGVLVVLVCVLAVLATVSARRTREAQAASVPAPLAIGTELPRPRRLPDLHLVSASGRPASSRSWRGKWVVLAPSMTLCHEVCPMTTEVLTQLAHEVRAAGLTKQVVVADATVDPWRDSPRRLRAYRRLSDADFPMYTGTQAEIRRLWRFFGVTYKRVPEGNRPDIDWLTHKPETFDVQHEDAFFIIDPGGQELVVNEGMPKLTGRLPAALRRLLSRAGEHNLAHPQLPWTSQEVVDDLLHVMNRDLPAGAASENVAAPDARQAQRALADSPTALASLHRQAGRLITTHQGLADRIAQLRGHPIVINAWASYCGPCQTEFPLFAAASAHFGRHVAFIGADINEPTSPARSFLAQHPVSYPSYPSTPTGLARWGDIEGLPTTMYLSSSGKALDVHTGPYDSLASLDNDVRHYALGAKG
jgi:cytochrome oxidase Cu insertion factor (SCO1/SenC/PrrC family)